MSENGQTPIPLLKKEQRLYVCKGSPWKEAVKTYYSVRRLGKVWYVPSTYRAGDLMLTILETDPPVAFCLDVATVDGGRGKDIRVDDSKTVLFDHGLSVERIKKKLGFTPQSRGFYEGEKARKILQALRDERAEQKPWFAV